MVNWTINDQSPESLGVTFTGWTETPMSVDVLTLEVVDEDYTADIPAGLDYDDVVVLKKDGVIMFTGRVTRTPRMASGDAEGWRYEVSSPWWDLDNLAFQEQRNYGTGLDGSGDIVTEAKFIGYVILGRDGETTGERIEQVLDFAISQGANLQKGTIDAGIPWVVNEHKDQTCGQIIRDYMRLVPDHVAWIDYTTATPTFNVTAQADLAVVEVDIADEDTLIQHDIDKLDVEVPRGIVIRYERPDNIDGQTIVTLLEDTAGAKTGFKVLPVSVPLAGMNITTEKAVSEVRDIPANKTGGDAVKSWWILHQQELAKEIEADDTLLAKIVLPGADDAALGLLTHTLELPDLPEAVKPLNPDATPIAQTEDVADYPRELIGGALPDWTGRKTRRMDCRISLLISKADFDGLAAGVRKALKTLFSDAVFTAGAIHYVANVGTSINATNATNREYSNIQSFAVGEDPPSGIAAAVLAQYARVKHRGSLTFIEDEITKILRPGQAVNVAGGRAEWGTMAEIVQSVDYDVENGKTTAQIGPAEQLGVVDMIDRLQAFKRVPSSWGFDPDEDKDPQLGGVSKTPRETNTKLEEQPPAQSHYFGPLEVFRKADGGAEIIPVPMHFYEMTHSTVKRHDVTLGGVGMTDTPPPQMSLSGGFEWKVYCKFNTDDQGEITGAVTAHFTTGAVPGSTHHNPVSDYESGTAGVYRKLIGIYDVPYSPADRIIYQPVSSPSWECIDRKFVNLGSGKKVHKSTAQGVQNFRTLVGVEGSGPSSEDAGLKTQGTIIFEEDGDEIKAKVFYSKSDLGAGGNIKWELTTTTTGDPAKHTYRVASAHSSIMDGTNGSAIDLTTAGLDADVPITETKFIYLEATVSGSTITSWTLTDSATDDPEIGITAVAPIEQDKIRLRIGKVTIADGVATVEQYATDCKVIGLMFVSGLIVYGFSDHEFTE